MPPEAFFDYKTVENKPPLYDIEAIRKVNPQRFEMEQLTAIVHVEEETNLIVGYKDITENEFWVRGHMPGFPLMPGVVMCEAAAQLTGFYSVAIKKVQGKLIVFSGMEEISFRGQVKVGDRLWIVGKNAKISTRQFNFPVQGFVNGKMVFAGRILGMPYNPPAEKT